MSKCRRYGETGLHFVLRSWTTKQTLGRKALAKNLHWRSQWHPKRT